MTETLSISLDTETRERLDDLAKRSNRPTSSLAAEAISAYLETEEWQLREIQAGIADADAGRTVSHEAVAKWLRSWRTPGETKAPL